MGRQGVSVRCRPAGVGSSVRCGFTISNNKNGDNGNTLVATEDMMNQNDLKRGTTTTKSWAYGTIMPALLGNRNGNI